MFSIVVVYGIGILCINTINTEGINSNKNLYYNLHVPKVTANRMGIFTAMKLDLERLILGFEENVSIEVIRFLKMQLKKRRNIILQILISKT